MKTVLTNATLIDGVSPEPRRNASVIIEDGRITKVGGEPSPTDREGAQVEDLDGAWLLPGLFDAHNHMVSPLSGFFLPDEPMMDWYIRQGRECMDAFEAGLTSLRVVGAPDFSDVAWKRAFDSGMFLGPRLFVAGHALTPTAGHGKGMRATVEADGPDEFRRAVRQQIQEGVDLIKIIITGGVMGPAWDSPDHPHYLPDELQAAFDTAHQRGFKVAVHAGSPQAVKMAVRAGAHTIEHGYHLDEECVRLMAEHGTYFVPTLCITNLTAEGAQSPYEKAHVEEWPLPLNLRQRANDRRAAHIEAFRMAMEAGVRIASGSDAGPLKNTGLIEIELLVRCGMSPMQAIVAATKNSAEACGAGGDLGTVEPGKLADLVVLSSSPLENIHHIRTVKMVFKAGVLAVDRR